MPEIEWLKTDRNLLRKYLMYVAKMPDDCRHTVSERKLLLIGCGCLRLVWDALPDEFCRQLVAVAEEFADDLELADESKLNEWHRKIDAARHIQIR